MTTFVSVPFVFNFRTHTIRELKSSFSPLNVITGKTVITGLVLNLLLHVAWKYSFIFTVFLSTSRTAYG